MARRAGSAKAALVALPHETAESLTKCQVETPAVLVDFVWSQVRARRPTPAHVLDLGAGQAPFARPEFYQTYSGYEIDPSKVPPVVPPRAAIRVACASSAPGGFDICVGNPPYIRPQWVNPTWREAQISRIQSAHGFTMSRYANLYLYFVMFALEKTKDDGLVALVVPADWTTRPSGEEVMKFLRRKKYAVSIYAIKDTNRLFKGVLTTETVLIIEKRSKEYSLQWYSLTQKWEAKKTAGRSAERLLRSANRGNVHAFRGLSPGDQETFVLTEAERKAKGIPKRAVVPAVTSVRNLDRNLKILTKASFEANYVRAGKRCWLIRTDGDILPEVMRHLDDTAEAIRTNYTCRVRKPWYRFSLPPVPQIVYSSGFNSGEPKFFLNEAGARVVGSVHGIAGADKQALRPLLDRLRTSKFRDKVVLHAKGLQKIEVRQMNGFLNS